MNKMDELYSTYYNDVFKYIRKISKSTQIAEEITAETFLKAIENIDKFNGHYDIRNWLCCIAKNIYITHFRKLNHIDSFQNIDETDFLYKYDLKENIEEKFFLKECEFEVIKSLHSIPEPYKEVFMLRVFAELKFKQIGKLFGKTENWAYVVYYRSKNKIKDKFKAKK